MKKKKRNNKQKLLLNIKINKDLNWNDVEVITGYTRQNIDHAFKNGTQKTIDKVLEMLESVWFFYVTVPEKVKILEQVSLFWFFLNIETYHYDEREHLKGEYYNLKRTVSKDYKISLPTKWSHSL